MNIKDFLSQANDSLVRLGRLQTLQTSYQALAKTERKTRRMEQVLEFPFMVDANILQEIIGHSRNRIFRADAIFQALEGLE